MEKIAKRLLSPAFIASLFLPPVGLGGLLALWIAIVKLHKGDTISGIRTINLAKTWIRTSIYISLGLLLVTSIVIYLLGPRLIAPMGAFY